MSRFELFRTVHQGLRPLLFDAHLLVARTDFSQPDEVDRARQALARLLEFLDEHAAHEDRETLPALRIASAELHSVLEADHARLHHLHREIRRRCAQLPDATPTERESIGRRLYRLTARLIVEHLEHMDREEGEVQRMLWAHYRDAELIGIEQRILAAIPPARLAEWFALILPAITDAERRNLVGGLPEQSAADGVALSPQH